MSRDLSLLHPDLQKKFAELKTLCENNGLKIQNTSTLRNAEEQADCVKRGTSSVSYPNSMHNWGVAVDFCRADGKGAYNDADGFFSKVGRLAESIGLIWGGSWNKPDKPHLQLAMWGVKPSEQLISKYGTPDRFKQSWLNYSSASPVTEKSYLEKGDRGEKVTELQKNLNAFGYNLAVDGIYGEKTEAAVKSYQRGHGLVIDGVAGIKTFASLEIEIAMQKATYQIGKTYTLQTNLKVRTGPGTGYRQKQRSELSADGQKNAKAGVMAVLLKGTSVTAKEVQQDTVGNIWIRIPSGWVCASEGRKVYIN